MEMRETSSHANDTSKIVIEGDSVLALLRDDTLTIHSMSVISSGSGGGLLQTIIMPMDTIPLRLTSNPYGIAAPNRLRDDKMTAKSHRIIPLPRPLAELPRLTSDENLLDASTPFEPPPGSGLSPPLMPVDIPSHPEVRPALISQDSCGNALRPATTTIAETLLYTEDSVIAITPRSWLLIADAMIDQGKLDDAVKMTEIQRRKGKRGEIEGDKVRHSHKSISHTKLTRIRWACRRAILPIFGICTVALPTAITRKRCLKTPALIFRRASWIPDSPYVSSRNTLGSALLLKTRRTPGLG
jgi:hypothetical protein